jgi:hypothetical protein
LGTGAQLLDLFNGELKNKPPFTQLRNAAETLWEKIADYGMLELLKRRFTVAATTADMTDILRFPWEVVYTTNYDNSIELAAQAANTRAEALNNTDDPLTVFDILPIIHLHGYVNKWDVNNIRESCVLTTDSYFRLTHVGRWIDRFRRDIAKAQVVVFVGFNAEDFHLNQAIYDLTGLKEKAFFINRPIAQADPDVGAGQMRLGTPLYSGRLELANRIAMLLKENAPSIPSLSSFKPVLPIAPATGVPTAAEIEDLLLFGHTVLPQLTRDIARNVSEYHLRREAVSEALESVRANKRILLFTGYPCDGKSVLTGDLAQRLSGARPVYKMVNTYETLLKEVATIIHYKSDSVVLIENCFDLPIEWLESIARQFDNGEGLLILTSREISVDASSAGLSKLEKFGSFRRFSLERLTETESQVLADLIDQIAGWREFKGRNRVDQLKFIRITCESSLPHVLMRLLESEYVTRRYREEFNKLTLYENERLSVILSLYVSHIGENITVSFLSNLMKQDFGAIIDSLNRRLGNDTFRLVRRNGEIIETVPSIGAQNILKTLFSDKDIINAVVMLLHNLADVYRDPFEQRIFNQIMRYSILQNVVTEQAEIDRFFENNKQHYRIRRMPLFWLQWHMAKCAAKKFVDAETFLEQGYKEAADYERTTRKKFDKRQLDDRRAKFLMLRAKMTTRDKAELFRDFKETCDLTLKVFKQNDPQHYPFETLEQIVVTFGVTNHRLLDDHRSMIEKSITGIGEYARKRHKMLPKGYQQNKARSALEAAGFPPDG